MTRRDIWSEWLLNRRFGGDATQLKATLDHLRPIRDKVLLQANISDGETLLDVGCGDGLIAFGALQNSASSKVIFSDISEELLNHARAIAADSGFLDRCRFVPASADDLRGIDDASVDAVTVRSVLIYVKGKQSAFSEFHRVLRRNGRLSIFEPVNSFRYPEPPGILGGISVEPVAEIAEKLKAVYLRIQPPGHDPLFDIDERKLLHLAEEAGFTQIHVEFHAEIKPHKDSLDWSTDWETLLRSAPNPRAPTFAEAMKEALTPAEIEALIAHVRPLYEAKQGVAANAFAYLCAIK